jgi:L-Ala-D/L-Glu epimerase
VRPEVLVSKTTVVRIEANPIDIELTETFGIATGRLERAENVVVEVELADGTVGVGEAAPFPAVNGESRAAVLSALAAAEPALRGLDASRWRPACHAAREALAPTPSALCAVETALLDAFTRHLGVSLWKFFGGAEDHLWTDITLVTGDVDRTRAAAERAARAGFRTLKIKIGGVDVAHDTERLRAVAAAAPECRWVLDGNTALGPDDAVELLQRLGPDRSRIALFEQPTPTGDLEALRQVRARTRVPVAADESARSTADVQAICSASAADVINLKITKSGVLEALDMAVLARRQGLGLMIGGMVETTLAMTTSACLAAGLGGFAFVDLDTPLFMKHAPTEGGFEQRGPWLGLAGIRAGHGVRVSRENSGPRH